MNPSHYDVLGLQKDSTQAEIKAAFRKLSLQWHPDKNADPSAEERFKQIAEAYAVLSDPEKRTAYDTGWGPGSGAGEYSGGGYYSPANAVLRPGVSFRWADSIFREFFGGRDPFAEMDEVFASHFGDPWPPGQQQGGGDATQSYARGGGHSGAPMPPGFGLMPSPFFGGGLFGSLMGGFGAFPGTVGGPGGWSSSSSSFASFSSSSGGAGMTGRSVSSTTSIENGERVTRTVTTIRHADGRVETTSDEQRQPLGGGPPPSRQVSDTDTWRPSLPAPAAPPAARAPLPAPPALAEARRGSTRSDASAATRTSYAAPAPPPSYSTADFRRGPPTSGAAPAVSPESPGSSYRAPQQWGQDEGFAPAPAAAEAGTAGRRFGSPRSPGPEWSAAASSPSRAYASGAVPSPLRPPTESRHHGSFASTRRGQDSGAAPHAHRI